MLQCYTHIAHAVVSGIIIFMVFIPGVFLLSFYRKFNAVKGLSNPSTSMEMEALNLCR